MPKVGEPNSSGEYWLSTTGIVGWEFVSPLLHDAALPRRDLPDVRLDHLFDAIFAKFPDAGEEPEPTNSGKTG